MARGTWRVPAVEGRTRARVFDLVNITALPALSTGGGAGWLIGGPRLGSVYAHEYLMKSGLP